MKKNFDIKKEWEKTKKELQKFSKEAAVLAKKGEKELVRFSKTGKLHLDSTALSLRIERYYYMIGKEYVKSRRSKKASAKLNKLVAELREVEKEQRSLKGKIKKTPKKTSRRNSASKS